MRRFALCLMLTLGLAACGGGSGTGTVAGGTDDGGAGDDGGGATPTDFTAFVKDLFDQTSDTTDPVDTNGVVFENTDDQDPTAFDDLLGP